MSTSRTRALSCASAAANSFSSRADRASSCSHSLSCPGCSTTTSVIDADSLTCAEGCAWESTAASVALRWGAEVKAGANVVELEGMDAGGIGRRAAVGAAGSTGVLCCDRRAVRASFSLRCSAVTACSCLVERLACSFLISDTCTVVLRIADTLVLE